MKIYYNPKLKTLSRELRKKGTLSEVLLWNALKGKKIIRVVRSIDIAIL